MPWALLLDYRAWLVAAIAGLAIYAAVQRLEKEQAKAEFAKFRADVQSEAAKAKVKAAQREAADLEKKRKSDDENKRTHDSDAAIIAQLRRDNSSSSRLPEAPSGSKRPDLACFDRAEYQRADGATTEKLFAGARGLADEGTAATIDLNTARAWAQP